MASEINIHLAKMRKYAKINEFKNKGNEDELALLALLKSMQNSINMSIFHSYSYPIPIDKTGNEYPGNIFLNCDSNPLPNDYKMLDNNKCWIRLNNNSKDEIDLLVITEFKIFVIEVKAKSGKNWIFNNYWDYRANIPEEKPVTCQSEKHARYMYHHLIEFIPEGNPEYIQPMIVYVDEACIKDKRSKDMKRYLPLTILNLFESQFKKLNKPLKFKIDMKAINLFLKKTAYSIEGEFI